ncbi:MAG: hypothetical protein JO274_10915 [Gammaproteobacteria bacterium]|nr:hypothetical protein [Gammaproteobacteria bacterium]
MLGPEKLPRVVSEVGRWVGRARAMARQFREQLEEEVQLEEARKAQAQRAAPPPPEPAPVGAAPPAPATAPAPESSIEGGNGRSGRVTHDTTHREPPSAASASDSTATRAAPTGSADERRT